MSILAWIVLGAIAGYLAGFLVRGDEGLGIIGHIVLGIVGALVGGFLAGALFNSDPINGPFDISSIVVSVIGAVITVVVVNAVLSEPGPGSGPDHLIRDGAHHFGGLRRFHRKESSPNVEDRRIDRRRSPRPRRV